MVGVIEAGRQFGVATPPGDFDQLLRQPRPNSAPTQFGASGETLVPCDAAFFRPETDRCLNDTILISPDPTGARRE
jgi:hypothetical protein